MPDNLSLILTVVSLLASGIGIVLFISFQCSWAGTAKRIHRALGDLSKLLKELAAKGEKPEPQTFTAFFTREAEWVKAWTAYDQTRAPDMLNRAALVDAPLKGGYKGLANSLSALGLFALICALLGGLLSGSNASLQTMFDNAEGLISPRGIASLALSFAPLFLGVVVGAYQDKYPAELYPLADEIAPLVAALYTAPLPAPAETSIVTQVAVPVAVAVADVPPPPVPVPAPEEAVVKKNLVEMLETVLAAQIERQTAAFESATQKITAEISGAVTRALEKPLQQIAQAAEHSAKQGDNVTRVLQEATAAMTRDIGKSIAQSMEKPLQQIAQAAEQSAKQGAETAEATGRAMTAAMTATLEKPLGQMVQVVEQSGRMAENVDRILQNTIASLAKKLEETVGEQTKGMNALLLENAKSLHDMKENVAQMMADMKQNSDYVSGQTRAAIEKMDASAKTILEAAAKFGEAGDVMNSQISHSHSLSRHMMESGMALNASATALGQVVTDYAKARDSLGGLIASLQDMAKGMDQKITINQSLVGDMQKVADKLKEVQSQTDDYLDKVSGVLSNGFTTFGKSVHENLEKSTTAFHSSMSNSVELISVQMRNLTSALQELPELLGKPAA